MKPTLLQNIKMISPESPWHQKRTDLLIAEGKIQRIGNAIEVSEAEEVKDASRWSVSAGWVDLFSVLREPGFEHKDTTERLLKSACFGGFTQVAVMPNVLPVTQSRAAIQQIKQYTSDLPVKLLPVAAATVNTEGKEMTELYDLHHAGAIAFSDGTKTLDHMGVLQRILLYVQPFSGVFINKPTITELTENGQMHEGEVSTALGMPGIPSLAESTAIARDLALLEYTGGRMHFSHISTQESIKLIRQAKQKGLAITADVAAHQLYFTDNALEGFDTHFKVFPPLRAQNDIDALWAAIADDTLDAIVSSHEPHDLESKDVEFDLADAGILGLETAFAAVNTKRPTSVSVEKLIEKFVLGPRMVLKLSKKTIKEGEEANLTLFDEQLSWTFRKEDIQSKSSNTPFLGEQFMGKAIGCILGEKVAWNL